MRACWCGNSTYRPFGVEYGECDNCGTLVYLKDTPPENLLVKDDESDFYGKKYWLERQQDRFGTGSIFGRARTDLTERNLYWLRTLLQFRLPPGKVMELGCSHGSFVALMQHAGFNAMGVEMSPWVVEFAQKTFGVPILLGPIEDLDVPSGSLDVIVLMDVLEHLPNPVRTMESCLQLLKPEGILLVQTPEFQEKARYEDLVEEKASFLEMLIPEEHIYLFSKNSASRLFRQLGAEHIEFEPAIFSHYDMFFAVGRHPIRRNTTEETDLALEATPSGRIARALLDVYNGSASIAALQADKTYLIEQLHASEIDRAARLEVIQSQGEKMGQIPHLEGRILALENENQAVTGLLNKSEHNYEDITHHWWVRLGVKIGIIPV
jgi:2-polyprenyl-3-methyl-5-hydroxy-6-metoxy-1,4-benzoquinol methylase